MQTAPPDSPDDATNLEHTAAIQREQVVEAAKFLAWNGNALEPWSEERRSLFVRLTALDVPGGDLDDLPRIKERFEAMRAQDPALAELNLEDVISIDLYLPAAVKLLYLASHTPEQFFSLRGRPAQFLAVIEAWAAANIDADQRVEACFYAQEILAAHRSVTPLRRVKRMGAAPDAGN